MGPSSTSVSLTTASLRTHSAGGGASDPANPHGTDAHHTVPLIAPRGAAEREVGSHRAGRGRAGREGNPSRWAKTYLSKKLCSDGSEVHTTGRTDPRGPRGARLDRSRSVTPSRASP